MEGEIGDCISTVTYNNKLGKPVLWHLYPMKCTKVYDWWPESDNRNRKWVKEEELDALTIDPLSKSHLPRILQYMHSSSCSCLLLSFEVCEFSVESI